VAARRVDGLGSDLHHYDPLRDALELMRSFAPAELEQLTPAPAAIRDAAAVIVISAVFWRARFKYGQRGYRFALLEAGHVAQNILLGATALGFASVPLGGFFDRQVNDFLELDGLHDAALYLLPIGLPAAAPA
jgi:SagB-type dehydrogenase family enzyme